MEYNTVVGIWIEQILAEIFMNAMDAAEKERERNQWNQEEIWLLKRSSSWKQIWGVLNPNAISFSLNCVMA